MKSLLPSVIVLATLVASAQDTTKHDPLLGGYFFANSVEIVCLTDSITGTGTQKISERILDLVPPPPLHLASSSPYLMSSGLHSARFSDCITGDFDKDGEVEIATGWVEPGGAVKVQVGNVTREKPAYTWTWASTGVYDAGPFGGGAIRLVAADLDGVAPPEMLVCAFMPISGADGLLFISALNVSTTGYFSMVSNTSINSGTPFDVAAGDLDGDGTDEIMHVCRDITGYSDNIMVERLDYDIPGKLLHSIAGQSVPGANWTAWKRLKITIGDFRNLGYEEAVVSMTLASGNTGRQVFNYITWNGYPQFSLPLPGESPAGWTWGNGWESDAVAADLNFWKKDGDELVVAGPQEAAVLKFDASLKPVYLAQIPFRYANFVEQYERRRMLAVADMDADTSSGPWVQEIIVAEHLQDKTTVIRVLAPTIDTDDQDITGLSEKYISAPFPASLKSEIAVGDFDGDATHLGTPTLVTKQSVLQPIVELNVPPTHFDYLEGQTYDICKVYGLPPRNEFKVIYTVTESQTERFSSELTQAWGVSGEISAGFRMFGVNVKASVKAAYDRGYYGYRRLDTVTTITQTSQTWIDDLILATETDYDFWEYPLYSMGSRLGNVLVAIPYYRGSKWIPRKASDAQNWMADHEVGNLFSYTPTNGIGGWTGNSLLASFTTGTVTTGAAYSWTLQLSEVQIDSTKLTNKVGLEVGTSIEKWGIEAKVSGQYSSEEISTHTSKAARDVTITASAPQIPAGLGNTNYEVKPYIYWGRNGALIVDYAVDPSSTAGTSLDSTFWDKKYLKQSDPGFLLPWRLDSLKGNPPSNTLFSTSLHISPVSPAAGDTLHIAARVHNFSLKDMAAPATVRFYLGNPASGGTPIVGTHGELNVTTGEPIPRQGRAMVGMDWVVPSGLDRTARIYAAIDPDNGLTEIHEDNNVGYVPLAVQDASGIGEETVPPLPTQYILQQNYPNPFNPSTVIPYELPERVHVTLTVYDILGRTVATLVNEQREAGRHHVVFDGSGLASGVYLYRLTAQTFVQTRKLLLLR